MRVISFGNFDGNNNQTKVLSFDITFLKSSLNPI